MAYRQAVRLRGANSTELCLQRTSESVNMSGRLCFVTSLLINGYRGVKGPERKVGLSLLAARLTH